MKEKKMKTTELTKNSSQCCGRINYNKYAIFTAVIGNYDEIRQPEVVDDRFDYILWTDSDELYKKGKIGVWEVRKIYYADNLFKLSRYVKTSQMSPQNWYKFTVWIDANIQIADSYIYERSIQLYKKGAFVSALNHTQSRNVYDEMVRVLVFGFEREKTVLKWADFLRKKENLYYNYMPINETGILYRRTSKRTNLLNQIWWSCIDKYSRRDQLSFNYVLSDIQMRCVPFMKEDVRKSEHFNYYTHACSKRYITNPYFTKLVRYAMDFPDEINEIEYTYKKIFKLPSPMLFARLYSAKFMIKSFFKKTWMRIVNAYYRIKG